MGDISEKAIIVKSFGSYDCLSVGSVPLPSLDEKIEIDVYFCGLNFADLYTRQGLVGTYAYDPPFVLGMECSGVVTAIGVSENCSFKIGQRVVCYDCKGGLYQSKIRIDPNYCYALPDYVSFAEGASIFVNYLTAYFALFELGGLKKDQSVLIQSCAGGLGCASTQLAKTVEGVKVLGTTSSQKTEAAKKNGVDVVLSYSNLEEQVNKVLPEKLNLIIDNQSGKNFESLQNLLKHLGRIVSLGANCLIDNDRRITKFKLFKVWWTNYVEVSSLITNNRGVFGLHLGCLCKKENERVREILNKIFVLLEEKKIKPIIDSIWPFEEIVSATKVLAEKRNVGKVLLSLKK